MKSITVKSITAILAGLLLVMVLPVVQPAAPLAAPTGPEACALCSQFPQYCNACYLFLWVVSVDPENWEVYYE